MWIPPNLRDCRKYVLSRFGAKHWFSDATHFIYHNQEWEDVENGQFWLARRFFAKARDKIQNEPVGVELFVATRCRTCLHARVTINGKYYL
jgi:hypothetical protein